MLRRTVTALSLLLIGIPIVILGGPLFFILIAIFMTGAAWEYIQMFKAVERDANTIVTVGGGVFDSGGARLCARAGLARPGCHDLHRNGSPPLCV